MKKIKYNLWNDPQETSSYEDIYEDVSEDVSEKVYAT